VAERVLCEIVTEMRKVRGDALTQGRRLLAAVIPSSHPSPVKGTSRPQGRENAGRMPAPLKKCLGLPVGETSRAKEAGADLFGSMGSERHAKGSTSR